MIHEKVWYDNFVVLPEETIAVLIAFMTQLTMYAVNSDVSTVGVKPKSKTRMCIVPTMTRINMAK